MENEDVVVQEVAEAEFDRFTELMDLDVDQSSMDTEDVEQFLKIKRRLLRAIRKGALVVNEDGEAVYAPQRSASKYRDPLTFHERTGADLMAMDSRKKGHDMSKTYAIMAGMCRVHPKVFAGLAGIDGKVCEAIFTLLMD